MAVAKDTVHNSILLANRPKKPGEAMARPCGAIINRYWFFHTLILT